MYNEVFRNTQARMNLIIGGSIGSAVVTYEIIALFGYLTFGSKVSWVKYTTNGAEIDLRTTQVGANIIAMYPSTSLFIAVGQLAIVLLVLFGYPLQVHPCRNSIDKVLHPEHVEEYKPVATEEGRDVIDEHEAKGLSTLKHTIITTVIIASGFTIAYLIDDLRLGELLPYAA